ncbi:MAG: tetratricopeptide repeat protein [Chromatiaceae bacterium]|nr:tetratricopeptide repeat protein [Chromatiaceae bacterium]
MKHVLILVLAGLLAGTTAAEPGFVGSAQCTECHVAEAKAWRGSHHDLAMAEASDDKVLGDFNDAEFTAHGVTSRFFRQDGGFFVRTDGPDGKLHDYRIRYTFGWYPLQQYLVEFPNGHVQALGIAWDSRSKEDGGQHWFHLYPNEQMDYRHPQHWTARDQTWNYQCAECHSTKLDKNYDLASDSFRTRWSEINVACEACHGPGSAHIGWARAAAQDPKMQADADKGLVVDLSDRDNATWSVDPASGKPRRSVPRERHTQIALCARCHSRRGQIWADYEYGEPLSNTHRLAMLDEQLYFPDGQIRDEVYVYGSFIQSRMYAAGVTCSNCHDPHSLQLRAQGNAVCAACHLPDRYDTPVHHHHGAGTAGAACTACHMPQRVYMVNDWRADHSMRVPRPDLSVKLGTPNACNACHTDKSNEWAAAAVAAWYPDSSHRGPHFGEALYAAANGSPDAADRLSAVAADPAQPAIARATAIDRLRSLAQPQHLFTVQRLLADKDPLVRAAAVRFLEVTDVRTQVDQGWTALDDPDRVVRLEAARILAPLMRQRLPDKFRAQLTRAIEAYAQSQYVNAERPESHLNLGLIAVAVGDAAQAEQAYQTALRLDPSFAPAYVNLADLYRQQQRDKDGERILRTGIEAVAQKADLQHALGLLLVREKRLDDALPYLRQAAASAPDTPRYAYVYALALQGAGEAGQAIGVLEQANQRHPLDREILLALVSLQRDSGDLVRAKGYADQLLRHYPDDPQLRALRQGLDSD